MQKLGEREPARTDGPLAVAPALSVQFFLIPLAVVAVVVAVYGGFRLIVADERSPEEYLNEIRTGGRDRRWPAAYELARIMAEPETEAQFPGLGLALVQAFVSGRDLVGYVDEARATVDREIKMPAGYRMVWGGQFENQQRASARLMCSALAPGGSGGRRRAAEAGLVRGFRGGRRCSIPRLFLVSYGSSLWALAPRAGVVA